MIITQLDILMIEMVKNEFIETLKMLSTTPEVE